MEAETEEVSYEAEASKDGWAPQDQWKGDPDKWKTAEKFVSDGKNINGILKSKIERLDGRVNELLESNKKFNEFSQRSLDKEKAETAKLIKELEQVRKTAVTEGDGDAFANADSHINELRQEPAQERPADPYAEQWLRDNDWYNTDEELATFADGIAGRVIKGGFMGKAYYDELTRRVEKAHPAKFGNANRDKPNAVESGSETVIDSKDQTFVNLPKEAKDAYKNFKRDIPGFTKEQYVEQYDWE